MLPYWDDCHRSGPAAGKTVLVAAHGNSLRALVKHLDGISDDDIAGLNIPTGIPLVYDLDDDLRPVTPGGTLPRPRAAAAAAIEAVSEPGQEVGLRHSRAGGAGRTVMVPAGPTGVSPAQALGQFSPSGSRPVIT